MKTLLIAGLVGAFVFLAGCTGPNPYVRVDLDSNLAPETLRRYEAEWKDLNSCGQAAGPTLIEKSNWWPLGLLIYHRDSLVVRSETAEGPSYTIMNGEGFGPLSAIYAGSTHATFNAQGERVNMMHMGNYLLMHLAMTHKSETVLPDGRTEKMSAISLFMHILNIHKMGGHRYVSLLTLPNAVGGSVGGSEASCH